jgi:prepilin-type N-terminal cleavage/methylation domain-containing protein
MKTKLKNLNQGFTIIEVMIVLAIAGLIMAIVFFAVPQLTRNAHDNQRQSIANRLKTELDTYSSNNQGVYPFTGATGSYALCSSQTGALHCNDWLTRYITTGTAVNITDPSTGSNEVINIANAGAATVPTITWAQGNAWITAGGKCQGEATVSTGTAGSANSKRYALEIALERTGTFYCVDNG